MSRLRSALARSGRFSSGYFGVYLGISGHIWVYLGISGYFYSSLFISVHLCSFLLISAPVPLLSPAGPGAAAREGRGQRGPDVHLGAHRQENGGVWGWL